jgi:hypothetical protein
MINGSAEEKLEKLLKLVLASDKNGEVVAAARTIRRTDGAGSDVHELAAHRRKLSETEMQRIYDAAFQDGKNAAVVDMGFEDVEGPDYHEMAKYCVEHDKERLTPKERGFVEEMVRWRARREPARR